MAEELQRLIDKINEEAVASAESKAKAIEDEARAKANQVIEKAKRESKAIIEEAKREVARMEASAKASIQQAGRDLVLSLRQEMGAMLGRLTVSAVNKALTTEEMAKIILSLVKSCGRDETGDVVVSLKKEDLEKLEKGLRAELHEEIKKGLTLKASDEIRGGFTISYDKGKSCCDFTDTALAEYLGNYLRPKLRELLKD